MAREKAEPKRQNKTRITVRLATDLVQHFKAEAAKSIHSENPVTYQQLIAESLRRDIDTEAELQRILREKRYRVV